ncbi:MAG: undecaprenyldiphospho-muramoylpentapeptide beta-N-acetylglucosaminyltransferase [Chloroflexota bacterium]|nr:undecaprenyldiphospho-muramoylpentapeptide beta-N-acetylglucosaminyltransferase [Chloroflexota bacterium]
MRLLVTGGGTGGHIYPALSVVDALSANGHLDRGEVGWVGNADSLEERVLAKEGITFYPVAAGALRGKGVAGTLRGSMRSMTGIFQAWKILYRFDANVVLATGGYVSVPLVLAAWLAGCPVLIYLPDMEPGLAVRFLAFFARRVAVSFPVVARRLPSRKVIVSGYPVRGALYATSKEAARDRLGLDDGRPVLLILGGSQGAHSINEAVRKALVGLLERVQLVHISGFNDQEMLEASRRRLDAKRRARYHLFPYLYERMTDALVAADLVVARSGAATLGEFPAVGLPAILVPYPYAGQHQEVNARYLAERGAAIIVQDDALDGELLSSVQRLLDKPEALSAMADASRALAVPQAAERIGEALCSLAKG